MQLNPTRSNILPRVLLSAQSWSIVARSIQIERGLQPQHVNIPRSSCQSPATVCQFSCRALNGAPCAAALLASQKPPRVQPSPRTEFMCAMCPKLITSPKCALTVLLIGEKKRKIKKKKKKEKKKKK